ncbi:hypothetical protein B0H13DRAFT_1920545 [Mycena leptocephala]|nr:hypothetical protein B0H13DRAFT_1920545 [Mycena leptocephala]
MIKAHSLSTLPDLPQEVINNIVAELNDVEALKACSLAGPLSAIPASASSSSTSHLVLVFWIPRDIVHYESPHLGRFIKYLTIRIYRNASPAQLDSLRNVLSKLTNVRRCSIYGNDLHWKNIIPGPLVDFLSSQQLFKLHLSSITAIPPVAFLQASPSLSFCNISLERDVEGVSWSASPSASIEDLVLHPRTSDIYALLTHPVSIPYINALRRLSLDPNNCHTGTLIAAAADEDPYIRAPVVLPALPALRFVEAFIGLPTERTKITFLLDTITSVLTSSRSSVIDEIVVTFEHVSDPEVLLPAPDMRAMAGLDAELLGHSAAPPIRWRISFAVAEHATAYANHVKGRMPLANAKGKLVVEEYQRAGEYPDQWPLRRP